MSARHVTWHWRPRAPERKPPNKRLKLPGGDRSNRIGVLCPGGLELSFHDSCAGGRGARSLSAIR